MCLAESSHLEMPFDIFQLYLGFNHYFVIEYLLMRKWVSSST